LWSKVKKMRKTLAAVLIMVSSTNISAQSFEDALWPELAIYSLFTEKALGLIKESSSMVQDKLKHSQQLQTYSSNKECLGSLQLLTMGAAVMANVMPFSSVHLKEDEQGPTGRYRLLLNGDKVHFSAYCDEESLQVSELKWDDVDIDGYTTFQQDTFDAAIGGMLLAYLQGMFAGEKEAQTLSSDQNTNTNPNNLLDSALDPPATAAPLTKAEKSVINFSPCWVIQPGSRLSNVAVTVGLELSLDGKVIASSMKLISFEGGTESEARVAFQSVRRAILRCQKDGYDLPKDKYDQWKYLTIIADPRTMSRP